MLPSSASDIFFNCFMSKFRLKVLLAHPIRLPLTQENWSYCKVYETQYLENASRYLYIIQPIWHFWDTLHHTTTHIFYISDIVPEESAIAQDIEFLLLTFVVHLPHFALPHAGKQLNDKLPNLLLYAYIVQKGLSRIVVHHLPVKVGHYLFAAWFSPKPLHFFRSKIWFRFRCEKTTTFSKIISIFSSLYHTFNQNILIVLILSWLMGSIV